MQASRQSYRSIPEEVFIIHLYPTGHRLGARTYSYQMYVKEAEEGGEVEDRGPLCLDWQYIRSTTYQPQRVVVTKSTEALGYVLL